MKRKENRQDQVEKLKKQQNIQEEKEITWVYSNDVYLIILFNFIYSDKR